MGLRADALDFAPAILRVQNRPPSPLPRLVLYVTFVVLAATGIWAAFGKLDVVAIASGKLVPQGYIKVVQPSEAGIVREILVKEGDPVHRGQVLVRLDAQASEADLRILRVDLRQRVLQLRAIEAELGGVSLDRRQGDDEIQFKQVEAQFRARRQAYDDALAAERASLGKAVQDLMGAQEVEVKLRRTAPIYEDLDKAWDQLAREGFAGKLLAMERRRARIENEQDLKAQEFAVASVKGTIEQATQRIAQITSNYQQQLLNERVEADSVRHRIEQELAKHSHRHGLLELRAPESGIVKELGTHTLGTVVSAGVVLMTVVPHGEPLEAEVWINNPDAGFVRKDQTARIKVAAFPFQKHGTIDGTVRHIGADATESTGSGAQNGAGPGNDGSGLRFKALISLQAQELVGPSGRHKLGTGMQVSAEVNLGSRTVLEYVLSPIQRALHEAARER